MTCNACGLDKSPEDFYNRHAVCKPCYCERRYKHRRENPKNRMLASARSRAKADGVPFDLGLDDIEIPEFCPVLGIKLQVGFGVGGFCDTSPSLDKIIPTLGYVRGNIAVISSRANRLKNDGTPEELQKVASWLLTAESSASRTVGSFPCRIIKPRKQVWICKDDKELRVLEIDLSSFIDSGWQRGRYFVRRAA